MKKGELNEELNVGIPCYKEVEIETRNLTNYCSIDEYRAINAERELFSKINDEIKKITNFDFNNRYFINMLSTLLVSAKESDSRSEIYIDDKQKTINLYKTLVSLERTLPEEEILNKIIEIKSHLIRVMIYIQHRPYTHEYYEYIKNNYNQIYHANGSGKELRYYLKDVCNYFDAIERNLKEIKKIDVEENLQKYYEYLNTKKTAIFIINRFLKATYIAMGNYDFDSAKEYLFYISSYLKNKKNDAAIYVPGSKHIITLDEIRARYNQIIQNFPELYTDYFDRKYFVDKTKEENSNFIYTLKNIKHQKTNEVFLKKGHIEKIKENSESRKRHEPTEEEKMMIESYLMDKMYFYMSKNPISKITNEGNFSNYIAFLYENGIIVADRFYKVNTLSESKSDAVYGFDIYNFKDLIKLTKQDLIGQTPRFIHKDSWKEKVSDYITKETNSKMGKDAKEFARIRKI